MEPARSIARLGFRRWYERRLLEAHAWLVTCLFGAFAGFIALDGFSLRSGGAAPVLKLAFAFAAFGIAIEGWRRYGVMMAEAMRLANRAVCARCQAYGTYEVLRETARMPVRCRACAHEWTVATQAGTPEGPAEAV